ncbi:hypothetical protein BH09ACT1_BH09ACT1_22180 [soil metagenome]
MTYSIVARDSSTGELGVAVQSHWFSVGSVVVAASAGVGAIATQASPNLSFKHRGLGLLRDGMTAAEASALLREGDPAIEHRQFAIVDLQGEAVAFTGTACMGEAGQYAGEGYACQANMMRNDTVWSTMAAAFEGASGPLSSRLLTALDAAEGAGGDLRGKQSAAILIVPADGSPSDTVVDLRVEDHREPLVELRRLVTLGDAYQLADEGDEFVARGDFDTAAGRYVAANEIAPDNDELRFWAGLGLMGAGQTDRGLVLLRESIASDDSWHELLRRLDPADVPSSGEALRLLG